MIVVLAVLAALLLLAGATLAVPVAFAVHVERERELKVDWRLTWLFGLVEARSGTRRTRSRRGTKPGEPARTAAEHAASPPPARRGPRTALALLGTPGFLRRAGRLVKDLARLVACDVFSLHVEFGLDDPADTGRLYAALVPLQVAAMASQLDVRCQPNFLEPGLRGSCDTALHVTPLSVIGVLAGFLCSPPALRAARAVWKSRR